MLYSLTTLTKVTVLIRIRSSLVRKLLAIAAGMKVT
jgi:hypothetical protein